MTVLRRRVAGFLAQVANPSAGAAAAARALALPPHARRAWLAARSAADDYPTVHALLDAAAGHLDDSPREALGLTALVLGLATPTPACGVVAGPHLRGRAWQEHGQALRQLGDLLGAADSFARASRLYASERASEVELAATKCAHALVLHRRDGSEGALAMLRVAAKVLAEDGETSNVARCHLYEGVIHAENHRFESATRAFEAALALVRRIGDQAMIARLQLHLGHCAQERGDRASAISYFERAVAFFERAGMRSDRNRVAWGIARQLASEGEIDRAVHMLEEIAAAMARAGLRIDATLACLDMLEIFALAGRSAQVTELAPAVMDALAKAGMFREAHRVVALLRVPAGLDDDLGLARGDRGGDA